MTDDVAPGRARPRRSSGREVVLCAAVASAGLAAACVDFTQRGPFPVEPPPPSSYEPVASASAVRVRLAKREAAPPAFFELEGRMVCFAPCTLWVPPSASLRVASEDSPHRERVSLAHLPPGGAVRVRVETSGSYPAGLLFTAFGGTFVLIAGSSYAFGKRTERPSDGDGTRVDLRPAALVAGAAMLAFGIPLLLQRDVRLHVAPDPL